MKSRDLKTWLKRSREDPENNVLIPLEMENFGQVYDTGDWSKPNQRLPFVYKIGHPTVRISCGVVVATGKIFQTVRMMDGDFCLVMSRLPELDQGDRVVMQLYQVEQDYGIWVIRSYLTFCMVAECEVCFSIGGDTDKEVEDDDDGE